MTTSINSSADEVAKCMEAIGLDDAGLRRRLALTGLGAGDIAVLARHSELLEGAVPATVEAVCDVLACSECTSTLMADAEREDRLSELACNYLRCMAQPPETQNMPQRLALGIGLYREGLRPSQFFCALWHALGAAVPSMPEELWRVLSGVLLLDLSLVSDAFTYAVGEEVYGRELYEASSPSTGQGGRDTLVVESDPVTQAVIAGLLRTVGLVPHVASSPAAALRLLSEFPMQAVILTVHGSAVNGCELARHIRFTPEPAWNPEVPIIAVADIPPERYGRLDCGTRFNAVLVKPIQLPKLLRALRAFMPGLNLPGEAAAPQTPGLRAALNRMDHDVDLFRDVAQVFLDTYPRHLAAISSAWDQGDFPLIAQEAHRMRGALSNFHAATAVEAAEMLESAALNRNTDRAQAILATVQTETRALAEAIAQFLDSDASVAGS